MKSTRILTEKFTEDVSTKNTIFYPCSGMDVKTIKELIEVEEGICDIENSVFILVDLNIDPQNDIDRNFCHRMFYFDNKLGLEGIKIEEKEEYILVDIENLLSAELVEYKLNDRFNYLIQKIYEPKAIRYTLNYKGNNFVIYLFHYEAMIISDKIKSLVPDAMKGLIIKCSVDAAFDNELFINKMTSFNPDILILKEERDNILNYNILTYFNNDNNQNVKYIYHRDEIVKNKLTLERILRLS